MATATNARWRRAESALRTGAAAHLLGGALDLGAAIARYLLSTRRGRVVR